MIPAGYNPMRWDCGEGGENCFNKKRRPKIELFADCFPRRINFGDVDGLVELSALFCLLEWKGEGGSIRQGQRRTYVKFTQQIGNVVFVIEGDAETMAVKRYCVFWMGKCGPWIEADLEQVKERLKRWVHYVNNARAAE